MTLETSNTILCSVLEKKKILKFPIDPHYAMGIFNIHKIDRKCRKYQKSKMKNLSFHPNAVKKRSGMKKNMSLNEKKLF